MKKIILFLAVIFFFSAKAQEQDPFEKWIDINFKKGQNTDSITGVLKQILKKKKI